MTAIKAARWSADRRVPADVLIDGATIAALYAPGGAPRDPTSWTLREST
jgi:hypothetical protein